MNVMKICAVLNMRIYSLMTSQISLLEAMQFRFCWYDIGSCCRLQSCRHEENIRDLRKTVYVVFKYVSRGMLWKAVGSNAFPPRHHTISQLIRGDFF